MKKKENGSAKLGPSQAYLRLLEGRTTAAQYSKTLKRSASVGRMSRKVGDADNT